MRVFQKTVVRVYYILKNRRCYSCNIYDEIIAIGETCLFSTTKAIKLFLKLGFITYPEKSFLQSLKKWLTWKKMVSFQLKEMLVTHASEKREKILSFEKGFKKEIALQ